MTTDHPPMTDAELNEIRGDITDLADGRYGPDAANMATAALRLIGEVGRLRGRVEVIDHQMQGVCPSCGHHSLTVDERGYLACHWSTCKRPDAASRILADADPDHILYIDDEGFTIRHPLHERLDNALLDCDLDKQLDNFAVSGRRWPPGRYRVSYYDHTWAFAPIDQEDTADHG